MTDTEVDTTTATATETEVVSTSSPSPTPTSPKDLIKVMKPDKNKLLADCKVIEEKRDLLEAKIVSLRREIDSFSAEEQAMEAIKTQKTRVKAEFDALRRQKDSLEHGIQAAQNDRKQNRSQMRFNSVAEIEKEIKKLESRQSTTSMSLTEEKKLLKEISALNDSKKMVEKFANTEQSIADSRKSKKELDTLMDAKKKDLDKIYDQSRVQYDKMNVVGGKKKEVFNLLNEKKKYKTEIDALWTVFKDADKKFRAYQDALRAAKREQYKKEEEQRKAEEDLRKAEIEAEEAKKIPYEEEMALCEFLANYLEKTYVVNKEEDKKEEQTTGEATVEGLTAFKRDESDFMMFGGGKKKGKNGKKKEKKDSKKDNIILTMDMLKNFSMLQVEAPTTASTVPAVVEALQEKKTWYSEQPRPDKKEKAAKETSEKEGGEEKKKVKKEKKTYNAEEVDFPTLAGIVPQTSGTTAKWGVPEPVVVADIVPEEEPSS